MDLLEKVTGIGIDERKAIWAKVKENAKKRDSCQGHDFIRDEDRPGAKFTCKVCGCSEDVVFVLAYQQGVEHGKRQNRDI